jgi:hypothetical protein
MASLGSAEGSGQDLKGNLGKIPMMFLGDLPVKFIE